MKSDFTQMKLFQKRLELAAREQKQQFFEDCARELAARFLAKVIKRTPVGNPDSWKGTYKLVERVKKGKNKGQERLSKNRFITSFKTKEGNTVSFEHGSNYQGGTLRRGWTAKTEAEAESGGDSSPSQYVQSLKVKKIGSGYQITIINPVSYSSYVEFGHETRGHKGWVPGQFMMTISEKELQTAAPGVLKKKFREFLQGVLDGK